VDLSDAAGTYDVYTSKMIEERVEVKEGDILIIHTGYHHFGWDSPPADEIRYMVEAPRAGPGVRRVVPPEEDPLIGVDAGGADTP